MIKSKSNSKIISLTLDKKRRMVVVGKSGFLGSAIIKFFQGNEIQTIGIGREDLKKNSLTSEYSFAHLLKDGDTVIYAAGSTPVRNTEQFSDNLYGIENFLNCSSKFNLKQLIYVSSDAVYKDSKLKLKEDSICLPDSLHGLMHLTREQMLRNSHFKRILCIVRPTLVYGAKDTHEGYGPNLFMRLAKKNKDIFIFGKGEEMRDHIYIDDVVAVIFNIIKTEFSGTLNLVTGNLISFIDIAKLVKKIMNSKSEIKFVHREKPMPHQGYRAFDIENLVKTFPEFTPIRLEEGLTVMKNELS